MKITSNMTRRLAGASALLLFLGTSLLASSPPPTAACAGINIGCESGASHGLGVCSALGWLYRTTHAAGWVCSGSTVVTGSYVCDPPVYDKSNCCGVPNNQSCPPAQCPCPIH